MLKGEISERKNAGLIVPFIGLQDIPLDNDKFLSF